MPERIHIRRQRGWRKPEGAIVVARPGKWGNPWRIVVEPRDRYDAGHIKRWYWVKHVTNGQGIGAFIDPDTARRTATSHFRWDLEAGLLPYTVDDVQRELAGHDLACWCPPTPLNRNGSVDWLGLMCHGEVFLDWANLEDK